MSRNTELLSFVAGHPLHRAMGVETIDAADGRAVLEMTVAATMTNPAGMFHGGIVYTLCDVVCYAALLGELGDGESAATHDIHVSVLRAAKLGERVRFTGMVVKRGRDIAFLAAEAHCGDRLLARASVTKSILRERRAPGAGGAA